MKMKIVTFLQVFYTFGTLLAQDVFYVYRNDGQFNVFYCDEVDSIVCSQSDMEGNMLSDYQYQVVYTADSVYWIPISVIDSISFSAPDTEYGTDVVKMYDMLPYITGVDGMTISFSSEIPRSLLPRINDILLCEDFDHELLPTGFAGRVRTVSGLTVECDSVSFEDIYRRVIGFGEFQTVEEHDAVGNSRIRLVQRRINMEGSFTPSVQIKETLGSASNGLYASIDAELAIELRVVYKFEAGTSPYFDLSVAPVIGSTVEMGIQGKLDLSEMLSKKINMLSLPIPNTLFFLKLKGGPVIKPVIEASVKATTNARLGFRLGVKYENGEVSTYAKNLSKGFDPPVITGNISGSVFAGIQTEFGVFSAGDVLSLSLETEAGAELSANMTADLMSSNKYEEMSKAKVDVDFKAALGGKIGFNFMKRANLSAKLTFADIRVRLNSWKLLPSFKEIVLDKNSYNMATLSVIPTEKLLIPITFGLSLSHDDGSIIDYEYCPEAYRVTNEWPLQKYQKTFTGLTPNTQYTATPMVKFLNMELEATPPLSFETEDIPVKIYTDQATDIESRGAVLRGHTHGDLANLHDGYSFGFRLSTEQDFTESKTYSAMMQEDGELSEKIKNLIVGTTYYYQAFVFFDGAYYYGETESFTTTFPVDIVKLEVMDATYNKSGFTYNGNQYSFKYSCATSVKITDNDGDVKDWGYVYVDPDGSQAKVSLKEFGRSAIRDPRYAYCRGEAEATVMLKGYVWYDGEDTARYGEVQTFPIAYPRNSELVLTGCEFVGTEKNVTLGGTQYKYHSTFRFTFNAIGAYWLTVGTEEMDVSDSGWTNWNNELMREVIQPNDGENLLTVNYYYNDKNFAGTFAVRLKDYSNSETDIHSDAYVTYTFEASEFTGCTFHAESQ